MAIHDYNIINQTFPAFRADLNNGLTAILTMNSNATAPTTTAAYMIWVDTTTNTVKRRNAGNSAFFIVDTADETRVSAKAGAYTIVPGDYSKLITGDASGGGFTITLPTAASAGSGFWVTVKNIGATNAVTLDGAGAETIDGVASVIITNQFEFIMVMTDGTSWDIISTTAQLLPVVDTTAVVKNSVDVTKLVRISASQQTTGTVRVISVPDNDVDLGVATLIKQGLVELATDAETQAGVDAVRAVTAAGLQSKVATQADQETGSTNLRLVSPNVQHFHQSANKFWVNFNGSGTVAIAVSYNVTSVLDNGVGDYTTNVATDFSGADYAFGTSAGQTGAARFIANNTLTSEPVAGSFRFLVANTAFSNADATTVCAWGMGDQ